MPWRGPSPVHSSEFTPQLLGIPQLLGDADLSRHRPPRRRYAILLLHHRLRADPRRRLALSAHAVCDQDRGEHARRRDRHVHCRSPLHRLREAAPRAAVYAAARRRLDVEARARRRRPGEEGADGRLREMDAGRRRRLRRGVAAGEPARLHRRRRGGPRHEGGREGDQAAAAAAGAGRRRAGGAGGGAADGHGGGRRAAAAAPPARFLRRRSGSRRRRPSPRRAPAAAARRACCGAARRSSSSSA